MAPFLFVKSEYVRTATELLTLEGYAGVQNANLLNKVNYKYLHAPSGLAQGKMAGK